MLGFEIFVYRLDLVPDMKKVEGHGAGMLARWMVNMDGLRWLDALVEQGNAYCHSTGGYPERYIVSAKWIVPVLVHGIPKTKSPVVIGEDYVMPANWSGKVELDLGLVATCPPDQLLCVEAWDQS
jgi:hypothetical protein